MMKHLPHTLTGLFLALLLFSCKKEYSYEIPGGGGSTGSYQWSFGEGTSSYKGPTDTAYIDTLGTQKQLTISGHSSDNKDVISLQVFSDSIKIGTYTTNSCSFDYLRSGNAMYHSDLAAIGEFTVSITAIDSISITGTFFGTALDSGNHKKTITDGKFKVKFRSAAASQTLSNCKIVKLLYTDSLTSINYFALYSEFSNFNKLTNIRLSDSTSPAQLVTLNYPVTFSAGKVAVPVNGKPQYFTVDANGRATAFFGYLDPLSDTSAPVVVNYVYDAGGHMTKRTLANPSAPATVVYEVDYTWSGNLLTRGEVKYGGATVIQADYQYDASMTVNNFLVLHPYADELFYFQSSVSVGVVPDHALSKVTETYFSSGVPAYTAVSYLEKYVLDANKYVQSFSVKGDDFMAMLLDAPIGLYASTKYTLSYRCQ